MKRRDFINKTGMVAVGVGAIPLIGCKGSGKAESSELLDSSSKMVDFILPDLPYNTDALAPNIDAKTMGIHHGKHHAGYVRKLNAALKDHDLAGKGLEDILASVTDSDGDTGVRNNGGGHYNHSLFWKVMKPNGSEAPKGALAEAMKKAFGSMEEIKAEFAKAAGSVFGSGWAWIAADSDKNLFITSTPNQDNPLMSNIAEKVGTPILGIDVWEHAYYLNYQNKRKDYISNFMEIINWDQVAVNYDAIS